MSVCAPAYDVCEKEVLTMRSLILASAVTMLAADGAPEWNDAASFIASLACTPDATGSSALSLTQVAALEVTVHYQSTGAEPIAMYVTDTDDTVLWMVRDASEATPTISSDIMSDAGQRLIPHALVRGAGGRCTDLRGKATRLGRRAWTTSTTPRRAALMLECTARRCCDRPRRPSPSMSTAASSSRCLGGRPCMCRCSTSSANRLRWWRCTRSSAIAGPRRRRRMELPPGAPLTHRRRRRRTHRPLPPFLPPSTSQPTTLAASNSTRVRRCLRRRRAGASHSDAHSSTGQQTSSRASKRRGAARSPRCRALPSPPPSRRAVCSSSRCVSTRRRASGRPPRRRRRRMARRPATWCSRMCATPRDASWRLVTATSNSRSAGRTRPPAALL